MTYEGRDEQQYERGSEGLWVRARQYVRKHWRKAAFGLAFVAGMVANEYRRELPRAVVSSAYAAGGWTGEVTGMNFFGTQLLKNVKSVVPIHLNNDVRQDLAVIADQDGDGKNELVLIENYFE